MHDKLIDDDLLRQLTDVLLFKVDVLILHVIVMESTIKSQ